jgi:hypothetical protein
MTAEAECVVPMARMPRTEMTAEMAAIPMMEMTRPVMTDMAVVHDVVKVMVVKMMVVEIMIVKVAEMTAEAARHHRRCRECDGKQTKSRCR